MLFRIPNAFLSFQIAIMQTAAISSGRSRPLGRPSSRVADPLDAVLGAVSPGALGGARTHARGHHGTHVKKLAARELWVQRVAGCDTPDVATHSAGWVRCRGWAFSLVGGGGVAGATPGFNW